MATPAPAIFASLPEFVALADTFKFPLIGLAVVILALAVRGFVKLMGWSFRAPRIVSAVAAPPVAAPPSRPAESPPPTRTDVPPELLALIAAIVHCTLAGAPHRLHSITAADGQLEWAREGRRTIFGSHRPH